MNTMFIDLLSATFRFELELLLKLVVKTLFLRVNKPNTNNLIYSIEKIQKIK